MNSVESYWNDYSSEIMLLPRHADPAQRSSGSHASHYAPQTPAFVFSIEELPVLVRCQVKAGYNVAMLCFTETASEVCSSLGCVLMPKDPENYARVIYTILRLLDAADYDVILIEALPETEPWRAVRDRIQRAAQLYDK